MHAYLVYGLRLRSSRPLPWLVPDADPGGADPDVVVERGEVPTRLAGARRRGRGFEATAYQVLVAADGVGRFLASAGGVVVDTEPGAPALAVAEVLLGSGLGAVLHLRGILALHASAVRLPGGGVVALVGPKGVGKSTTAAFAHRAGLALVSDDVVALRVGPVLSGPVLSEAGAVGAGPAGAGPPAGTAVMAGVGADAGGVAVPVEAQAGFAHLKLEPASIEALGEPVGPHVLLPRRHRVKHVVPAARGFDPAPAPLVGVYVLDVADDVRTEHLPGKPALVELLRHRFRPEYLVTPAQQRRSADQVHRVVSSVPVLRLASPRPGTGPGGIMARVLAAVAGAPPAARGPVAAAGPAPPR